MFLWPGDAVWEVTPADEAVTNVSTSQLTVLGAMIVLFYKLCGKRQEPK